MTSASTLDPEKAPEEPPNALNTGRHQAAAEAVAQLTQAAMSQWYYLGEVLLETEASCGFTYNMAEIGRTLLGLGFEGLSIERVARARKVVLRMQHHGLRHEDVYGCPLRFVRAVLYALEKGMLTREEACDVFAYRRRFLGKMTRRKRGALWGEEGIDPAEPNEEFMGRTEDQRRAAIRRLVDRAQAFISA